MSDLPDWSTLRDRKWRDYFFPDDEEDIQADGKPRPGDEEDDDDRKDTV